MIKDNLDGLFEKIEKSAKKSGRTGKDISLVAVTKTVSIEKIIQVIDLGVKSIGENKIQEATGKFTALQTEAKNQCLPPALEWHLIGHLQTNKAKYAVKMFDFIQSVDSLRLAEEIDNQAAKLGKTQNCLAEVKVSLEPTKFGLADTEITAFFENCRQYKNITFCGIMAMAPFFEDQENARPYFAKARNILETIKKHLPEPYQSNPVLSMGMSNDFETAIEEGANMVRVGSAIFRDN
ncbi:MAG: YggS family pyridoxal phosphate enzyme [Elusimicrobia bacterium RIFOXYA2_FULL_39_19]|nr:MAG: YggS family pyridoxal phosphate enzyme [Elusimicrobia bacterium RIFOXYA2_FULL_39_19]